MHSLGYELGSAWTHAQSSAIVLWPAGRTCTFERKMSLSSPPCPCLGGQLITFSIPYQGHDSTMCKPGPVVVLHFTGPRKTPQI